MPRPQVQTATSLRRSPADDRRARIRKYTIAMTIRSVCLIALVVDPNWTRWVFGIAAIVLPYIAVVIANAGSSGASDPISPGTPTVLAIEPPVAGQ